MCDHKILMLEIGRIIRGRRAEKRLTGKQLGKLIGKSGATISRMEGDDPAEIGTYTLTLLCEALELGDLCQVMAKAVEAVEAAKRQDSAV